MRNPNRPVKGHIWTMHFKSRPDRHVDYRVTKTNGDTISLEKVEDPAQVYNLPVNRFIAEGAEPYGIVWLTRKVRSGKNKTSKQP